MHFVSGHNGIGRATLRPTLSRDKENRREKGKEKDREGGIEREKKEIEVGRLLEH